MNWFLTDNQGTVRDVVQYSGGATSLVDHLVYDSFGQIASQTQPANQPRFTYTGMRLDPVTGLYYDNARWLDALNGVFISQNPLGYAAGDPNTGRYCFNSPTNLTDPSGTSAMVPYGADGGMDEQAGSGGEVGLMGGGGGGAGWRIRRWRIGGGGGGGGGRGRWRIRWRRRRWWRIWWRCRWWIRRRRIGWRRRRRICWISRH